MMKIKRQDDLKSYEILPPFSKRVPFLSIFSLFTLST